MYTIFLIYKLLHRTNNIVQKIKWNVLFFFCCQVLKICNTYEIMLKLNLAIKERNGNA